MTNHWSLNGAQDKIALRRQNGQWYEAHGAEATTHIIKPGISNLLEQSFNEYVCMKTVSNLGVPTAESTYHMFGDVPAIISTRSEWQRYIDDNNIPKVARIHQEDFCQALGFMTAQKYQSDGGPDALAIVQFLYTEHFSATDIHLFYTALILNFLMAGTDAHAKNYAILEPAGESPMLAPLYDIASLFPYDTQRKQRKLAMSIGREYNYERIELRHWVVPQPQSPRHANPTIANSSISRCSTTPRNCPKHSGRRPGGNGSWSMAWIAPGNLHSNAVNLLNAYSTASIGNANG